MRECGTARVGSATVIRADVSKVAEIDRLFAAAMERYGRVDIVVASAGIEVAGIPIADITEADFDRVFDVNTKGVFFTLIARSPMHLR